MTANTWIKFITFSTIGILLYFTFSTPPSLKEFEYKKLSQPVTNEFSEDFEDIYSTQELFPDDFSRWHQITLQNNELKILQKPVKNCFINWFECVTTPEKNHLEITNEKSRRGDQSLKLTAKPTKLSFGQNSSLAIRRHLFDFGEGDDVYFSGWFYLENDLPVGSSRFTKGLAFAGLRSESVSWRYRTEPGRFLLFSHNNNIASDLLFWLPKPEIYEQAILEEVSVPFNRWVNIRFHLKLSNSKELGLVQVWQDNKKILYKKGQTLPESGTTYSILELGITKHEDPRNSQTIYLDEIEISDEPFFKL